MRRPQFIAFLIGIALLAAAPRPALAGGGGAGGICSGFATGSTVIMRDGCFDSAAQFVNSGATLVVKNEGHAPHSLTAVDGSFDTGLLNAGQSAKITFKGAGIIQIYCTLHGTINGQGMSGVLIVSDRTTAGGSTTANTSASIASGTAIGGGPLADDDARLGQLVAQTKALADLATQVTALRQAVDSNLPARQPVEATVLAVLGVLLGGGALMTLLLRRQIGQALAEKNQTSAPSSP